MARAATIGTARMRGVPKSPENTPCRMVVGSSVAADTVTVLLLLGRVINVVTAVAVMVQASSAGGSARRTTDGLDGGRGAVLATTKAVTT